MKTDILATAGLTAVTAFLFVAPAHAGIGDGTLNNAHVLDHISTLNSNITSDAQSLVNNNANTRADGNKNNATGRHE
ncbi:hypothetical protein [Streptomyces phaeoluteigriseus]